MITSLRARVLQRIPARRVMLKWGHLLMIPLFVWFVLVTPDDVVPIGNWAFMVHSNLALVFVSGCLIWTVDHMFRGLAGRPGPKLPKWARWVHPVLHKTIIWGLFLVALGGFLLGLTSHKLLKAGGFLPIAPPMNWHKANEIIGTLHIYQFYALGVLIIGHALFHIWRHIFLRDNVLRIMTPKWVHRWL